MYELILFTNNGNPYICKNEKAFNKIKRKYYLEKIGNQTYMASGKEMVYVVMKQDEDEKAILFTDIDDYTKATNDLNNEIIFTIWLINPKGKTYKDKKAALQEKANEYSNNIFPGLYMSDLILIQNYFETYGKRYGLLNEFKEESII